MLKHNRYQSSVLQREAGWDSGGESRFSPKPAESRDRHVPSPLPETVVDNRGGAPRFFSDPQSVQSLAAAILEPALSVALYLTINFLFGQPLLRPDLIFCLLVAALSFPGKNRFRETLLSAGVSIFTSWSSLMGILALGIYATDSFGMFDKNVLLAWAVVTPFAHWLSMGAGRRVLRFQAAQPQSRRKAVVIGAGPLGLKVATSLAESKDNVVELLGHFDDRTDARVSEHAQIRRIGGINDVAAFVEANGVRDVYITLPLGSQPRIVELMERLQGTTASLFFVPDVFGISIIQGRLQDLNGVPVVGICVTPFTGTNELVKRISDIVLSSAILLLISPILLAVAMGVKLSSPGPVIFKQRRNGLDGEEIVVYKFRSMTSMDNGTEIRQASKGDSRITPFGAFIRRTSLDELPQFINVLQGRMSIVGPRPHAVAHNKEYRRLIKAYMVRHKVKPGITGWAQVHGHRGETDTLDKMQMRVEYDLEYLRNWSLVLDLQIIAATVRVIFRDRNAY